MNKFQSKNILVIGDLILDEYITGDVTRISPEAPIPILDIKKIEYYLGGAGNVANNFVSLGAKVWIIGRVGHDAQGEILMHKLSTNNIYTDLLIKDDFLPTTVKTRFKCNNHCLLRVDMENKTSLEHSEFADVLIEDLDRHFQYFDAIIVSDYDKGVVFPNLIQHIVQLQTKYKKFVIADTHKTDMSLFKNFSCLTPNKAEFSKMVGRKLTSVEDVVEHANIVRKRFNLDTLLVTLSEDGVYYCSDKDEGHIPAHAPKLIDVTGAGDTTLAVYTLALLCGYSVLESAYLANSAAGIVVAKPGTATLTLNELLNAS